MKIKLFFFCSAAILFFSSSGFSQNPEWINYLDKKLVNCIAIEGNTVWAGTSGGLVQVVMNSGNIIYHSNAETGLSTNWINSVAIDESGNKWIGSEYGGLAKFDGTNWTVYITCNCHLRPNWIYSIAIDESGNKWIGTDYGLRKFDNQSWRVYDTSNSGLPNDRVISIAIDKSDNKWIGTRWGWVEIYGELVKFDGQNWIIYDESNSGLPVPGGITSIAVDGSGNKWIGTAYGGLVKFDGTNWTVYNTSKITSIAIDGSGNKWIGTDYGLRKFDGKNWSVYNTSNSDLPNNEVNFVTIDKSDNKWIGTRGGLAVFKEGGVVTSVERPNTLSQIPDDFRLDQNCPNPFNMVTSIQYELPSAEDVSIRVFNSVGQEVEQLINKRQEAGRQDIQWDGFEQASGIYFLRFKAGSYQKNMKMILLK